MIFTVVWTPAAEQRLAAVWLSATNRTAVTRSASHVDELLRVDPQQQGDLRFDTVRSIIVGAMGVEFEVVEGRPPRPHLVRLGRHQTSKPPFAAFTIRHSATLATTMRHLLRAIRHNLSRAERSSCMSFFSTSAAP